MKSIVQFMEANMRKNQIELCVSMNYLVHILHYNSRKSICGDISAVHHCIVTKKILIKSFIEDIARKIEDISKIQHPSDFWNEIDSFCKDEFEMSANFQYDTVFTDIGELIYESNIYDTHVDVLDEKCIHIISNSNLCKKCLGIFLGALFRLNANSKMDNILDQYL